MPEIMNSPVEIANEAEALRDVKRIAELLDSKFTLPFGWKIGWDGILGFFPGIGDLATNIMAFYIVYRAAILGAPVSVLMRMGLNLLIDNVIDTIPLLGNIFDFMWKANNMNAALLESYLQSPHRVQRSSQAVIASFLIIMAFALLAIAVLTFKIAQWLWGIFQTAW